MSMYFTYPEAFWSGRIDIMCISFIGGSMLPPPFVMIDDFNGPNDLLDSAQFLQIGHDLPSNSDASTVVTTSGTGITLGGRRKLWLHSPSGQSDELSNVTVGANTTNNPGLYIFNDSDPYTPDAVTTTATATLIWDGSPGDPTTVNTSGLGSVDITAGGHATGFYLDVSSISAGVVLTITVWSNAGAHSASASDTSAADENLFLPFADFIGVDFTAVSAIRADFTGPDEYQVMGISLKAMTA